MTLIRRTVAEGATPFEMSLMARVLALEERMAHLEKMFNTRATLRPTQGERPQMHGRTTYSSHCMWVSKEGKHCNGPALAGQNVCRWHAKQQGAGA
jgi:hypothetical protein